MKKCKVFSEKSMVLSKVDKGIFGSFLEHLGRAIYTGIYETKEELLKAIK